MNDSWLQSEESTGTLWSPVFNSSNETSTKDDLGEEELYKVPISLIVLLSVCYGTISILAVFGNALVLYIVFTSKRMQSVTNLFIANLAMADIVIGIFVIPFQFQAALLQRWDLPHFMCAFCPFVRVLCVNVSVFTLTAIAVDRHRAILKPFSEKPTKLEAKVVIIGIWIAGSILAAPMAVALRVVDVPEIGNERSHEPLVDPTLDTRGINVTELSGLRRVDSNHNSNGTHVKPFCKNINMSDSSMLTYRALLGIFQYLCPLIVISCVYARMALRLWGSRAPGNAEHFRDANLMKNKKKVIKMLVIVMALFAICWLPLQTYNVLQYMYPQINEYRYINIIWFCCDWLAMSNSCYNPFIYGIYNEKFKREFQQKCPFRSRKWSASPPTDSLDMDKTQTTKASFRYDWRRATSGNYPIVGSFYKSVPFRESSRKSMNGDSRGRNKSICYFPRNDEVNRCSSLPKSLDKNAELYVFPSGKHKHSPDLGDEELVL